MTENLFTSCVRGIFFPAPTETFIFFFDRALLVELKAML